MITYRVEGRKRQPHGWIINKEDVVECSDISVAEQNARVLSSTCDEARITPIGSVVYVKGSKVD